MSDRARSIVGDSPDGKRHEQDLYRTPAYATQALLDVEHFSGLVWEPACGAGDMSNVLVDNGLPVVSTDLYDWGYGDKGVDFLKCSRNYLGPQHIITNPPYKYAEEFVRKGLEVAEFKVAMLLKLVFLEGVKRQQFFKEFPPKTVYVFSKRVKFIRGLDGNTDWSPMIAFAWYVWDKNYIIGETTVRWI